MTPSSATLPDIPDLSIDPRKDPRDEVSIRARLKSLDPLTAAIQSTVVQIVEISRDGLKLYVTRPYLPGSPVQLRVFDQIINGKVRHCTPVEHGFHVGIERTRLDF